MGDLGGRLARGEPAAFAELYDACADRLHHYLVARLGSVADADDLVQETFVRLARGRHKLSDVDNLVAYVFTVARNETASLMASKLREAASREQRASAAELFEGARGGAGDVSETAEALTRALARLPTEQREIVELKHYAELTLRQIAEITGHPQGTVATRYRTAITQLREWLKRACHE
ncbi:MAG TPA: RNA polymerase sigma factor [Pirellulales bacterium]|jgi:RNA polymerase sigma-70 factor (ECF subfamily)